MMNLHIKYATPCILFIKLFIIQLYSTGLVGSVETPQAKCCGNGTTKCIRPIVCQFKKFCTERYNVEYGTSIKIAKEDEIQNHKLREELRTLANLISFKNRQGRIIQPLDDQRGHTYLPECVDSAIVKRSVLWYEYIFWDEGFNSCGPLGFVETFEFLKQNQDQDVIELDQEYDGLYCLPCISYVYLVHRVKIN